MKTGRRTFLKSGAVFALAFRMPGRAAAQAAVFEPNAYIRIAPDNTITLWMTRSEMGQGVRTILATTLAEELGVEPAQVRLEQALPGTRFRGIRLRTSGSGSAAGSFMALRRAGAVARQMLTAAAAETWQVDAASCEANGGVISHAPSKRQLRYGELAMAAARQAVPTAPVLKTPATFKLIGRPQKRVGGADIVRGRAVYGLDVQNPGTLVAVIERCPYLGGKLDWFESSKTMEVPGVRYVLDIRGGIFGGVAVVADNTWAAMRGRQVLKAQWESGPNRDFDSDRFIAAMRAPQGEPYPVRAEGNAEEALRSAPRKLEAFYEYPFQAHAPVEPMNCTADVRADSCEVWVPSQTPETAQQWIAKTLKLPLEAVKVHTTMLGGGFGRRLFTDYVEEAVELSRAIRKPVKVVWTRQDDMRHGYFQPAAVERMTAGLDSERLLTWGHHSVSSDLSMYPAATEEQKQDRQRYAKDESPWGAFDTFYRFPAMQVDYLPVDSPVPSGPWRAVMYPARVFARESFLDEVAHALGKDPLQYRIDLLQPAGEMAIGSQKLDLGRMLRVLDAARERSGWGTPVKTTVGRLAGRGIAINVYSGESYVAQVAEVSLAKDFTGLRVHRVVCVLDCGLAINPMGIEGQVESAIVWGLSATLHGKITFRTGRAVERNYGDFRVLAMDEMPVVETHILPSAAPPGGFGEHAVPHVAPAVANAIFAATGQRIRRLPITADSFQRA